MQTIEKNFTKIFKNNYLRIYLAITGFQNIFLIMFTEGFLKN